MNSFPDVLWIDLKVPEIIFYRKFYFLFFHRTICPRKFSSWPQSDSGSHQSESHFFRSVFYWLALLTFRWARDLLHWIDKSAVCRKGLRMSVWQSFFSVFSYLGGYDFIPFLGMKKTVKKSRFEIFHTLEGMKNKNSKK